MKLSSLSLVSISLITGLFSSCFEIELTGTSGGVLEDAILICSVDGLPPRHAIKLGDISLNEGSIPFADTLKADVTHWWIIGHIGSDVVFSSTVNLTGVDMYSIDPYDMVHPIDWNIPGLLDAHVNNTYHNFDWWCCTVSNHGIHTSLDNASSTLWRFSPSGQSIGTVKVNMRVTINDLSEKTSGLLKVRTE